MKTAVWSGVVGISMLVACGGGKAGPTADEGGGGPSNVDGTNGGDRLDVAGGETSEFSGGDIDSCPEIKSNTPLDLEQAEVASWTALAAGQHELGLAWENQFLTDAITGFDDHTQLSLDVSVLAGRELVYGTGGYESAEYAGCDGTMARQLDLEIAFETADGALSGSFRHWVELRGGSSEAERSLSSAQVREGNGDYDASSFTSAIDFGLAPDIGATPRLQVYLSFEADSVRGYVTPYVSLPPLAPGDGNHSWSPLRGSFPDNGCGPYLRAVALDEVSEVIGKTPRATFDGSVFLQQPQTLAAAWEEGGGITGTPGSLTWTRVTVSAGSATHACEEADGVTIHAPLYIETADGLVSLTQAAEVYFDRSSDGEIVSSNSPWIPSTRFAAATGMQVEFGEDEYGAVELNHCA